MNDDVPAMLARHAAMVATAFDTVLAQHPGVPPRLMEAMQYSLAAGGKRLRPALVLETFDALAADRFDNLPAKATAYTGAVAAALAIELVHTFSLVHDDLPAMDDDDLRRGRPTNHKVFGEATAILAGDAMLAWAFEILASAAPADFRCNAMVIELAKAAGPAGMIGGQVLDMAGENQTLDLAALQAIHLKKTGALMTGACRLGAIAASPDAHCADAAALAAVTAYGDHLGLAFQITDDVLDETATPQQLGKATNKDAGRGKNTYPRLLGLDGARRAAAEPVDAAITALAPLRDRGQRLAAVAQYVIARPS